MVHCRRILIAWAAAISLAAPAVGQQRCSFEMDEAGSTTPTIRVSPSGRQVRVWRTGSPGTSQDSRSNSSVPLAIPPLPADDVESETSGPIITRRKADDPGSPFADEPPVRQPTPRPTPTVQQHHQCDQCNQGGCDTCGGPSATCGGCGQCSACCGNCASFWGAHRDGIFGEFLALRPTGVDMAHAFQQDGFSLPDGQAGVVAPVVSAGFRVGFTRALNDCSSVTVGYTNFHSHATDTLSAADGGNISSLVLHPGTAEAGSTGSLVDAAYDVDFQLVDVDYRRLFACGPCYFLNYDFGLRYGNLRQLFRQNGDFGIEGDSIQTNTGVRFQGFGGKFGVDGERRIGASRLSIYGKSFISVLFGTFKSNYSQADSTTAIVEASSNWDDNRVVPIIEYEVGIRWTSCNGRWRLSTGFYAAYWFNTITTPQYVQAVQNANFVHLGETTTFDGLVSRLEFCY